MGVTISYILYQTRVPFIDESESIVGIVGRYHQKLVPLVDSFEGFHDLEDDDDGDEDEEDYAPLLGPSQFKRRG